MRYIIFMFMFAITSLYAKYDGVSLLSLSWHNAFCAKHKNRKECRPIYNHGANHLVLHGLWPEHKQYCGVSDELIAKDKRRRWRALPAIEYPDSLKKDMLKFMPGVLSALDRHEWIKHGTCYSSDPIEYFSDAISLTKEADSSMLGEYLRANIGGKVTIYNIKKVFDRAFGKGSAKKISMRCRDRMVTEIRITLKGSGNKLKRLLKEAPNNHSRSCKEGFVAP